MDNSYRDQLISRMALNIREKIDGAKLFGEVIDMNNLDEVMVASYYYHEAKLFGDLNDVVLCDAGREG